MYLRLRRLPEPYVRESVLSCLSFKKENDRSSDESSLDCLPSLIVTRGDLELMEYRLPAAYTDVPDVMGCGFGVVGASFRY